MSQLLPITAHWTDALCMAKRYFPQSGPSAEVAALCTRPKGHKGTHRMDAPAFPRITWKQAKR